MPHLSRGEFARRLLTFTVPVPMTHDAIAQGGQCAQKVMGDYYPVAIWCDRSDFKAGGWAGCLSESGRKSTGNNNSHLTPFVSKRRPMSDINGATLVRRDCSKQSL